MWKQIIEIAIGLGALLFSAWVVTKFWPEIKDTVSSWLRERNLDESALMDAVVILDKLVTNVRCRIIVETKKTGKQTVEEKILTIEELQKSDPDIYKELQKKGHVEVDIMELFE